MADEFVKVEYIKTQQTGQIIEFNDIPKRPSSLITIKPQPFNVNGEEHYLIPCIENVTKKQGVYNTYTKEFTSCNTFDDILKLLKN